MTVIAEKNRCEIVLGILILIYIIYFSFFTLLRHQTFHSSYYDLGIMDQTVYNTYQGRILELTLPSGSSTVKRMAIHNDILLAVFAPFYAIYNDPGSLLVMQTIIIALGAIPVYLISKDALRTKVLALIFAFAYLMYPPLQRANIFDFHAVTLTTTFILYLFYFALRKKFLPGMLFFSLAILTKEQVALTTAFFGIFLIWQGKKRSQKMLGRTILSISVTWFVLSIWLIIPFFRGGQHFAVARYQDFGESAGKIIIGILSKPHIVLSKLLDFTTLLYFVWILGPLAFTPLLAPLPLFIAAPEFAINLLSDSYNMRNVIHHYTAVITPFVFIASIYGVKRVINKSRRISPRGVTVLIAFSAIYASITMSPLPYSIKADNRPFQALRPEAKHVSLWKQRLADENIIVSATGTLAPHFAHRKTIERFPVYKTADYVVLFREEIENDWLDRQASKKAYNNLANGSEFGLIYKAGQFEVFKKK